MQEDDVDRRQAEARAALLELPGEEARVQTMPTGRLVLDDLRRTRSPTAEHRIERGPLQVARLGDDDDLVALDHLLRDEGRQHLADQPLTAALGVVGAGVDQVDPGPDRLL